VDLNIEHLKALAALAKENELAEITITDGDKSITIKTPASVAHTIHQSAAAPMMPPLVATIPTAGTTPVASSSVSEPPAPSAEDASLKTVTSPMVGTFFASSSPESPAYATKGSTVKVGQVLCIVEAMKQMNELESDVDGIVVEVLCQNGEPVEFGQPLFKVR